MKRLRILGAAMMIASCSPIASPTRPGLTPPSDPGANSPLARANRCLSQGDLECATRWLETARHPPLMPPDGEDPLANEPHDEADRVRRAVDSVRRSYQERSLQCYTDGSYGRCYGGTYGQSPGRQ